MAKLNIWKRIAVVLTALWTLLVGSRAYWGIEEERKGQIDLYCRGYQDMCPDYAPWIASAHWFWIYLLGLAVAFGFAVVFWLLVWLAFQIGKWVWAGRTVR